MLYYTRKFHGHAIGRHHINSTGYGQTICRYTYWRSVWLYSCQRGCSEVDEEMNNARISECRGSSIASIKFCCRSIQRTSSVFYTDCSNLKFHEILWVNPLNVILETLKRINIIQICEGSLFPIPSNHEKFINSGVRKWMSVYEPTSIFISHSILFFMNVKIVFRNISMDVVIRSGDSWMWGGLIMRWWTRMKDSAHHNQKQWLAVG